MKVSGIWSRSVWAVVVLMVLAGTAWGQTSGTVPRFAFAAASSVGGDIGIYTYTMDPSTAQLRLSAYLSFQSSSSINVERAPNFLQVDPTGKFLYMVATPPASGSTEILGFAISATDGSLTPLAGDPISCFFCQDSTNNFAFDPLGGFLYVSGGPNGISAYTMNSTTGALVSLAGSPFSDSGEPSELQLSIDPAGTLLYGTSENALCAFTINSTTGALTPVAGSPFLAASGDTLGSPTFDPTAPFLYVSDTPSAATTSSVVAYSINATTGVPTAVSTTPTTAAISAMTIDTAGKFLYVSTPLGGFGPTTACDASGNLTCGFSINSATGSLTALSTSGNLARPGGRVQFDPSGQFIVVFPLGSDGGAYSAARFNSSTGALTAMRQQAPESGPPTAFAAAPTPVNHVPRFAYVANSSDNSVSAFTIDSASGALAPIADSPFASGTSPSAAVADPFGRFLFVANAGSNDVSVYSVDPGTGVLTPVAGSPSSAGTSPAGLATDPTGQFLFVTNRGSNNASEYSIDPNSGSLTEIAGSPFAVGTGPSGIISYSSIATTSVNTFVEVLNSASNNITVFTASASAPGALGSGSTFALADQGTTPVAAVHEDSFAPASATNQAPDDLSLFFANAGSNNITADININSGAAASDPAAGVNPQSIAVDPTNTFVFVAGGAASTPGSISAFSLSQVYTGATNVLTVVPGSPFAAGQSPSSIAFDASGQFVYVANSQDNTVSAYVLDSANGIIAPITGSPFATGVAPKSIALIGRVQPASVVAFFPANLVFPTQSVANTSPAQTTTLTNNSGATLNITGISLTGTNAGDYSQTNTCGVTLAANASCTISVTFTPTASGTRTASLSVSDNAGGSPQTVSLTGNATAASAPAVTLAPASLTFSSQTVGTSSSAQNITLTNGGNTALTITAVTITGTNAGDYTETNTCGASLAASAICTISVTFKPTATGTRTASVSVADNASGSPQTVSLTGTGAAAAPGISFAPTSLTFTSQTVGTSSAPQSVTLTNNGSAALSITSVTISGANAADFSQTNTCGASLAASAICTISVTFKPAATGTLSASVSIADDASGSPQTVPLSGSGSAATAPAVTLSPNTLTFASQTVGSSSAAQSITLSNSGNATLNITGITLTGTNAGDYSETNTCGATLAASANCAISVTFKPTAAGTRTASVSIADNVSGSPQAVNLTGTGAAASAPAVTLAPASLTFPSQTVGTSSAAQGITLTNSGNAALTITAVAIVGANAGDYSETNTCGATLAASANCAISVTFKPTASGTRTASVSVADNASGSPQAVSLTGTATAASAPAVTLAPASLTFSSQTVGTSSAAQAITLTNSGNAALTITAVTIVGANAGDYGETNTCGATLAASANCAISVTFKPTATGTRTASVSVADNASGSPQTAALSGTAVGPDFSLAASPATLTITAGSSGASTISVTPSNGFNQAVSFTCSGLPTGASCSFSPSTVTPSGAVASTTLTITTAAAAAFIPQGLQFRAGPWPSGALSATLTAFLALFLFALASRPRFQAVRPSIALCVLFLASLGLLAGCAGSSNAPAASPVTVTGTSGSGATAIAHSVTISLTVNR